MKRSVTTEMPWDSRGSMTSAVCWARSAAMRRASAWGTTSGRAGFNRSCRSAPPSSVAPGSKVSRASRLSASNAACVDLPHPSIPSRAIRRPRPCRSSGIFSHPRVRARRLLPAAGAFLAAVFLAAGAFFVAAVFLPAVFLPAVFLAGAVFFAAFFLAGAFFSSRAPPLCAQPAARRPAPPSVPRHRPPCAGRRWSRHRSRRDRTGRP